MTGHGFPRRCIVGGAWDITPAAGSRAIMERLNTAFADVSVSNMGRDL